MVARLLRDKGIREYVSAAKIIKQKYPTARFQVLGPKETNPSAISDAELQNWIDEGSIEYLGSTNDVRPMLANSSVFVLPSYREGLSQSILEAMSMAKPIITTDVPGCRETVEIGLNGHLVSPQDSESLAQAMQQYIENPYLIEQMGNASRQLALDKFDTRIVNKIKLDALLNSAT